MNLGRVPTVRAPGTFSPKTSCVEEEKGLPETRILGNYSSFVRSE